MSPWEGDDLLRNKRFLIIMAYLIVVTAACSYAIKEVSDFALSNRALLHQVANQQFQIQQLSQESDYKLCLSVRQGKLDRIKEYKFTIRRTLQFVKQGGIPESSIQPTLDFYNDLIHRTRNQIIPCPPVPKLGER